MRKLKHLPLEYWPADDRETFSMAYALGDIFGKPWARKLTTLAAATFIATDAPELIGLVPGALQHASPDVAEQHYNLARSVEASRRFAAHLAKTRARLRPVQVRTES